MVKKIIGSILIIIGGLQLIMRMFNAGSNTAGHAGGGGPATHLGPLAGIFTTIGPLLIVVPIVFIIVGIILLTHKEKAVKK